MKHIALAALTLSLPLLSAPAQAEDIMSILARKADLPPRLAPDTIPYSYTVTVNLSEREGKDLSEGQAAIRIDPSQPPGQRAQILSISDAESDVLQDFLKTIETSEETMAERAGEFWCGDNGQNSGDESDDTPDLASDPSLLTVISEDETEAVLRPDIPKLVKLLTQSNENPEDSGGKMAKKLMKRIEGEFTLAKPSGEMKGFSVRMTRPMTMMVVAKLKVMNLDQTCALAPNGHYHTATMNLNVEGKALGKRFGQKMDLKISDLTPLP